MSLIYLLNYGCQNLRKKKNAWEKTNDLLEARQIEQSALQSEERNIYMKQREEWRVYLNQISIDYVNYVDLTNEINRIKDILEFSSFFRNKEAINSLTELEKLRDKDQILLFLKNIR